jgi:hypothetical protein
MLISQGPKCCGLTWHGPTMRSAHRGEFLPFARIPLLADPQISDVQRSPKVSKKNSKITRLRDALVMTAMLAVSVALAVAKGHASCQGAAHSNQTEPGAAGTLHSTTARIVPGLNGSEASYYATFGPRGQDRIFTGVLSPDGGACFAF